MILLTNRSRFSALGLYGALVLCSFGGCKPSENTDSPAAAATVATSEICAGNKNCIDMSSYKSVSLEKVEKVIWLVSNDFYAFSGSIDNFVAAKTGKATGHGVRFVGGKGKAIKTYASPSQANDPAWQSPLLPKKLGIANDSSKPAFHAFRFEYLGNSYWTDAENILKNLYRDYFYLNHFACPSGENAVWVTKNEVMELQCPHGEIKEKLAACEAVGSNVCNGK